MNIKQAYPPNIEKIKKVFPIQDNTVFTYGDTIFIPQGGEIDEPLLFHEATHAFQQGIDVEAWWDRYLIDKDFRFSQEIQAYSNQYQKFCQLVKDRNKRARFLFRIACDLSSDLYGNLCTTLEASKAIQLGITFTVHK